MWAYPGTVQNYFNTHYYLRNFSSIFTRFRDIAAFVLLHTTFPSDSPIVSSDFNHDIPLEVGRWPLCYEERRKLLPIGTHQRSSAFTSWRLCFETATQNSNQSLCLPQERVKVYELQILYAQSRYRSEQKSIKNVGKISCGRSHAGNPKNFHSTHIGYRARPRIARSSLR